jgi:hypothetical protein
MWLFKMDKALFKNTKVTIKDGYLYIQAKLDVVLESDTIKMRGNNNNDAVAIANTYQEDINDELHLNFQLNTNTKANKAVFKAKKAKKAEKAKANKKAKKTTAKPKTKKATKIVEINGLSLDLNDKWDAIKYAKIQARA